MWAQLSWVLGLSISQSFRQAVGLDIKQLETNLWQNNTPLSSHTWLLGGLGFLPHRPLSRLPEWPQNMAAVDERQEEQVFWGPNLGSRYPITSAFSLLEVSQ